MKLIDGLESKNFTKGEYIIKEGEDGDYFYIIEDGVVDCMKEPTSNTSEAIHVRDLIRGDYFGELALLNNAKRTLSVKVKSDSCKLLALGSSTFKRLLGENRGIFKSYDDEK